MRALPALLACLRRGCGAMAALGREDVEAIGEAWSKKFRWEDMESMQKRLVLSSDGEARGVWAAMITACTKMGRPEDGVSMFVEMKKEQKWRPCGLIYEALVFALLKSDRLDSALFAAQDMVSKGHLPGPKAIAALFDSLCTGAKSGSALSFIRHIQNLLATPHDPDLLQWLYSRFIVAAWRSPHSSLALETLVDMRKQGLNPNPGAYKVCIKLLCRNYRYDAAIELVKEMMNKDDLCVEGMMEAYTELMKGLNRGGRAKEAVNVAECVKERVHLDERFYREMLNSLFIAGRVNDAIGTFEWMEKEGFVADVMTYSLMIKNLCKAGYVEHALAVKKVLVLKGFQPDSTIYNALIQGLCFGSSSRSFKELLLLAQEMKHTGFLLPSEVHLTLVTHFCTLAKFDHARIWAKDMIDQGHQPTPYLRTAFRSQLGDIFGLV